MFTNKKRLSIIGLVLILLIGSYLRLWRISEYMTFLGDEGRDVLVVKRMIVDHKFTLLGPTASVGGFFLGPIYYYFMLPFLWFWRLDPTGPAVMVALFGVATIYLVYQTGKEFFNEKTGLIASSLYALSPLVIAHSRSSWNPNLVPFFSLLYIYSLWKAVKMDNKWWYLLAGVCLGVGLQLHYLFIFLIPVGIVYFFLYAKNAKKWKRYIFSLGGFLLGLCPFLAFELRHSFPNTQTIIRFILSGEETGFVSYKVIKTLSDVIFRLFARLVFYFPPPEQLYRFSKDVLFWWKAAIVAVLVLSLLTSLKRIIEVKNKQDVLILLWFAFGVGLFAFYQRAIYDYYLGIIFTLPFLLMGMLFTSLWKIKILKSVVISAFAGLIVLNWSGQPFKHRPNRQLEQAKKTAQFVFEKAEGMPFNFALITGQNSDHAYRYFLEVWGNPPATIENFANDPERKTVTDQLLIVCEVADCKPLGHSLWEVAGFGRAEIAGDWQVGVLKVFKLIHYQKESS